MFFAVSRPRFKSPLLLRLSSERGGNRPVQQALARPSTPDPCLSPMPLPSAHVEVVLLLPNTFLSKDTTPPAQATFV